MGFDLKIARPKNFLKWVRNANCEQVRPWLMARWDCSRTTKSHRWCGRYDYKAHLVNSTGYVSRRFSPMVSHRCQWKPNVKKHSTPRVVNSLFWCHFYWFLNQFVICIVWFSYKLREVNDLNLVQFRKKNRSGT